ncbi:multidrug RND transporter [Spirochaetia bacterium]|nr:multidrug RND transporter [Spirochaetia bacterium]
MHKKPPPTPSLSARIVPAAVFIFIIITVIAAFIARSQKPGESADSRYRVFSIRFEYFGMDSAEMERLITIPLEEKISGLGEFREIRSVSEYGKSVTTIYFDRKGDQKKVYLSLRDAVENLYLTLPRAVQKPRIYSAESNRKPFLSIAVSPGGTANGSANLNTARKYIENTLKKEFEALEGVAEVIVSGGSIDEIRIEFDPDRIAETGIYPESLGNIVRDANVLSPGGLLRGDEKNSRVLFNTQIRDLEEIKNLPVKAGEEITSLKYFAGIDKLSREPEEILKVNGEECIGIQIIAASAANVMELSRKCAAILKASELPEASVSILNDTGKILHDMIRSIITAILQSFLGIIIIIPFFFKSVKVTVLLILLLPVNILWTLGVLHILGLSPDQNVLSGISISLGLIVDPCLIIAGIAEKKQTLTGYGSAVKRVTGAIVASSVTTLLVIMPLCFLDSIVPGIRRVAVTIMVMLVNSLLISCIFFPDFVYSRKSETAILPAAVFRGFKNCYIRLCYRLSFFSINMKKPLLAVYLGLAAAAFALFFVSGKNISLDVRDRLLYASVEYDSERTAASIDRELVDLTEMIQGEPGVQFVRLESRKGTGELDIRFDERTVKRRELTDRVSALAEYVGDGFLYVPDSGGGFKAGIHEIEIAAIGDESEKCREAANTGAAAVNSLSGAVQTVLNFKKNEDAIFFIPDRDLIAKRGLSIRDIASTLRWIVFGPVVDKWVQAGTETDIRLVGRDVKNSTLERVANLAIPSPAGSVRLDTLGAMAEAPGSGKIYRRDGRRAAWFTAHIQAPSTGAGIAAVKGALAAVQAEKGYGFLLSRDLELLEKQYRILLLAFIGSIIGIFLTLTMLTEKWKRSLLITSIIPVSCALPLLVKFIRGSPLEMGDMVALLVISGISVNNAIYITESGASRVYFKVREKVRSILVTSLTNIAGAVPLALMSSGGFSSALAEGIIWGTLGSLIAALFLFPGLVDRME